MVASLLFGAFLFSPTRAPVGNADQGLQPSQTERAVIPQQALRAGRPRGALIAFAELHQVQLKSGLTASFAILDLHFGEHIAGPNATGKQALVRRFGFVG